MTETGGIEELAATVNQGSDTGGTSMRTMIVTVVNAGPPKSLDLADESGGPTVLAGIRYSNSYNIAVPAPGDVVKVLITRSGGSGRHGGRWRGGDAFVVDKIAV